MGVQVPAWLLLPMPNWWVAVGALDWVAYCSYSIYFEKIRVFKAGFHA